MADGPFREQIKKLVDRLEGGVAGVLMGFDGISIDTYVRTDLGSRIPDVPTLSMELAHLISQTRRTLQSIDAGTLGRVHASDRQADAGGPFGDAGVFPRLCDSTGRESGKDAVSDARHRPGAAGGPLKQGAANTWS